MHVISQWQVPWTQPEITTRVVARWLQIARHCLEGKISWSVRRPKVVVIIKRDSSQSIVLPNQQYKHTHTHFRSCINIYFAPRTIRSIHKINESFIVCSELLSTYLVSVDEHKRLSKKRLFFFCWRNVVRTTQNRIWNTMKDHQKKRGKTEEETERMRTDYILTLTEYQIRPNEERRKDGYFSSDSVLLQFIYLLRWS